MKKLLSMKSVILGILSISVLSISTINYATESVLETGNNAGNNVPTTTEITAADLSSATTIPTDNNNVPTTSTPVSTSNTPTTSTGTTTDSVYKTVDEDDKEKDKMPQTGIEDSYIGILLIIGIGVAIFTFKKVSDYKNI